MKKKILSILLCICLLSSVAALFSSCGFGGSKKLELVDYEMIYADDASDTLIDYVKSTHKALQEKTGEKLGLVKLKQGKESEDSSKYEILVGNTDRAETAKALKSIKGQGYTITVIKKKLVIVGTTNFFTMLALQRFNDAYLSDGEKSATLKIEKVLEAEVETFTIEDTQWAFVHSSLLADGDFVLDKIDEAKNLIGEFSDVRGTGMKTIADKSAYQKEIIVGNADRTEMKDFTQGMDALDYGIGIKNGKLLVAGLGDAAMENAFRLFKDMLSDSVVKKEETRIFMIPADFACIFTDTEAAALTDFPRPEGLALSGSADVHDGSTEFYYEGKGVSADAYKAYCGKLEAAGYTLHGQETTVEDSIYRTYVNTAKGTTLYVAYNAYKHAATQNVTLFKPAIRIVSAYTSTVNLFDAEMLAPNYANKIQESSVSTIKLYESNSAWYGNLYVIALQDGSFVLLDGGRSTTNARDEIYKVLLAYYMDSHNGSFPTANDPIRIAAWVVSHGHGDHTGNIASFINQYCAGYGTRDVSISGITKHKTYVTVDRLIANFISDEEHYNDRDGNVALRNNYAEYSTRIKDAPGKEAGFKYYKVHSGQRFWLSNVEFEVMHTHEDLFPQKLHIYNDASTVIRTHIYHTNNGQPTGGKSAVLWLGDAQDDASKSMRATYGSALQTEMVQYAHHGFTGCEWKLYQLVAPKLIWWPQGETAYEAYNISANASKSNYLGVNYKVSNNLASVHYIILNWDKDYTVTVLSGGVNYTMYSATNPYGIRHMCAGQDKLPSGVTWSKVGISISSGLLYTKHTTKPAM